MEAGVGSVTRSYNKIDGVYSCENEVASACSSFVLSDRVKGGALGLHPRGPGYGDAGGAKMTGEVDFTGVCGQDLCIAAR